MSEYLQTKTILIRTLVLDHRKNVYRYLRLVEIEESNRPFQSKLPYVVEEFKSFLYFIRWWKPVVVRFYFNFTEAKNHIDDMFNEAFEVTPETVTRDLWVMHIDINPERFIE